MEKSLELIRFNVLRNALTSSTGRGPEADFKRLARRFGCTPGRAKKIIMSLVDLGKITIENGSLNNKRALFETKNSQKNSEKQSEKANQRWSKKDEKDNKFKDRANAEALPGECQPEPEPEPYTATTVPKSGDPREPDPPPESAAASAGLAKTEMHIDDLYAEVLAAVLAVRTVRPRRASASASEVLPFSGHLDEIDFAAGRRDDLEFQRWEIHSVPP